MVVALIMTEWPADSSSLGQATLEAHDSGLNSGGLGWKVGSATYSARSFKSGRFNYMHLSQRRGERKLTTKIVTCHTTQKANAR